MTDPVNTIYVFVMFSLFACAYAIAFLGVIWLTAVGCHNALRWCWHKLTGVHHDEA